LLYCIVVVRVGCCFLSLVLLENLFITTYVPLHLGISDLRPMTESTGTRYLHSCCVGLIVGSEFRSHCCSTFVVILKLWWNCLPSLCVDATFILTCSTVVIPGVLPLLELFTKVQLHCLLQFYGKLFCLTIPLPVTLYSDVHFIDVL